MNRSFDELIQHPVSNIPQRLQPFLDTGASWDSLNQTWGNYAHAYERAFEVMARHYLSVYPASDNLIIPLFYLARHSMELALKEALKECERYSPVPLKIGGHSLLNLFDKLEAYLVDNQFVETDTWSAHCRAVLVHIEDVDPKGETFRYPESMKGEAFDAAEVDIEGLIQAHHHVTLLADCTVTMLEAMRPDEAY